MIITVNGVPTGAAPAPDQCLRNLLRAYGHSDVKKGCDTGDRTVLIDGVPAPLLRLSGAARAEGRSVTTAVGLDYRG